MQHHWNNRRGFNIIFVLISLFAFSGFILAQDDECAMNGCVEVAAVNPVYGLSEAVIQAYDAPTFATTIVNEDVLYDRRYVQVTGALTIYDAPNGNPISTLDEGFNFLTAINDLDGWTQINTGEWVLSSQLTDVNDNLSGFTGLFLLETALEYPVAWMLINAYPSNEPGGPPAASNNLIFRYTQVTLYDQQFSF
jgi:hypothetical protein